MRVRLAALAVTLLCVAIEAAQDQQIGLTLDLAHDGRGALAVLRRDGLIFPLASFDRDTWLVPWPLNVRALDIPAKADAIPKGWWGQAKPGPWRAYIAGGEPVVIDVTAPVLKRVFCSPRLWLETSYRSSLQLPPSPIDPFPKDGVAVSGDVPVEPIETVARSSGEWSTLAADLLDEFNRIEDATVRGVRAKTGWRHPIPAPGRHGTPLRLESWYRSPSGEPGWTVSYIESVRAYAPRPEDNGCGLETLVSGWLHHKDGVLKKATGLSGRLTYCDRVGATYMLPFGRIRPKEKIYWVFQLSGWESEWYDVAEVGRERVRHVVEVPAGSVGCF
ncbi:MAG TPA: hypothetical protein VFJ02_00735 [Vicinamibacterales bacterium]|nr:hypothetical protein [Vicinamibacterales bacterium]